MVKVKIYTTSYCPYCKRAKALLDKKGVIYEEIDLTDNSNFREELSSLTGGKQTVPQIFINDESIGGCTDLENLNSSGKLDEILSQQ
ncbi:MAG: glutaredoxin 3 [Candidatus Gastranaerophilales bacterium]|nr:glutaredoxin 3 [Candidatus Gastranaerophilales bacterium]